MVAHRQLATQLRLHPPATLMAGVFGHLPSALLLLAFVTLPGADAADRLKVIAPPPGQEAAEQLVDSLATACNSGDFVGFIGHFTPTQGRRIRGRMEDLFIKHQPQMDIRQVMLLSEEEEKITFGVRYALHGKGRPEEELASKVTARRIDGHWKLDGETVKSKTRSALQSEYSADLVNANVAPADWDPFNPPANRISPDLEHLRGDIGIQPGRGCANGQCRR